MVLAALVYLLSQNKPVVVPTTTIYVPPTTTRSTTKTANLLWSVVFSDTDVINCLMIGKLVYTDTSQYHWGQGLKFFTDSKLTSPVSPAYKYCYQEGSTMIYEINNGVLGEYTGKNCL